MAQKYTRFADIPQFTRSGSYAVDFPIHYLVKWINEEVQEQGLDLSPIFQRGHVWTECQQIRFVEFLLRGGKTGRDLYFNNPGFHRSVPHGSYDEYVCVDGLQRITAIQKFVNNQIRVFGSSFAEYTDFPSFSNALIRVHVNDLKTEEEVIRWYLEMNSGGTPHSKSELDRVAELLKGLEGRRDYNG